MIFVSSFKLHWIILPGWLLWFSSCGANTSSEATDSRSFSEFIDKNPLIGSWELVSHKERSPDGDAWIERPDTILYQKHITQQYFIWIRFNKESDLLTGIGGGTYSYQDSVYVENIAFLMPPDGPELGRTISFSVDLQEDLWFHTGHFGDTLLQGTDQDVNAHMIKYEEIWQPISAPVASAYKVLGAWELKTYREDDQVAALAYDDHIKYIKLITPTHFVWVKYNEVAAEVLEAGAGTYQLEGEIYTESVLMMYPPGSETVGTDIEFSYEFQDTIWTHMGYVNRVNVEEQGSPEEYLLIDEVWRSLEK